MNRSDRSVWTAGIIVGVTTIAIVAIKRLDRVRAQIDELVKSIECPDTTGSPKCPVLPRKSSEATQVLPSLAQKGTVG